MASESKTLERAYIIPLRTEWLKAPKHKRAKKAVRAIREFLAKHMKVDMKDVKIGKWLNHEVWKRGIKKPMAKVSIKAIRENGIVRVELAELPEYAKKIEAKLKTREEKSKKETKKEEKAKEEEKKVEEEAKEEMKENVEEKEKKAEEKIIDKQVKPEEMAHVPKDEHMHVKTKLMRTD